MSPKTKKKPNVTKVKASSIYGEFRSSPQAASEEKAVGVGGDSTATSSDVPEVHQEQRVDIAFCICGHSLESHDSLGTCHVEGCLCTAFEIETLQRTVEEIRNSMTDEDWKVMDGARMNNESNSAIASEKEDSRIQNSDGEKVVQSGVSNLESFVVALCIQVNENPEGFNADSFIHHLDASGLGRYLQYAKNLIEATQTEEGHGPCPASGVPRRPAMGQNEENREPTTDNDSST